MTANRLTIHDNLTVAELVLCGTALRAPAGTEVAFTVAFLTKADEPDMIDLMDRLGVLGTRATLALVDKIGDRF